ncbi:hypothetical protein RvY_14803 [Ramazzottius varieornatus]|uniref:Sugar phosphate transporter domain-containing protein n=1 Tax=Ramazzottius varieornatus TaxID=947166 RepID=A0A1D1VSL2_RAMVA|nr:hypothetical protein RvY_14803 [Ramazzottius varieornatus]
MSRTRLALYIRKRYDKYLALLKKLKPPSTMAQGRLNMPEMPRRSMSPSEQKNARKSILSQWFLVYVVKTVSLVALYYLFSIGLTFYQKKFIQFFDFPLTIVTGHFAIKFLLAAAVRYAWCWSSGQNRSTISCMTSITRIAPAGMAAALDIGMSNWSLAFITISLYTMTKSSTIVFILIFALLLKLEKFRWSLLAVVTLISVGLFLFTFESTQFHAFGFSLVLGASVLSGIRWTLSQVLMQKEDFGLSNPVDMIFHIQPWMFVTLLPLAIVFEGKSFLQSEAFLTREETVRTVLLIAGGGIAGFLMEVSEYVLLTHTSSITLSVAGISKEICQFVLAYEFYGDRISPLNFVGLVICMSGVIVHVVSKLIQQNRKLAALEAAIVSTPVVGKDTTSVALLSPGSLDEWDGLEEIDLSSDIQKSDSFMVA